MCTSIVSNGKKTLVGWNLDLADMPYKVVAERDKVYIAVLDATEGYLLAARCAQQSRKL